MMMRDRNPTLSRPMGMEGHRGGGNQEGVTSPAMFTDIVSGVAVAVILGALGAAWRWGHKLPRTFRQRQESDHRPLHEGPWQVHLPPDSDTSDARLVVVCAPSSSLHSPAFSPQRAVTFARQRLNFIGEPAYSGVDEGVRLKPPGDGHGFRDYVWVCTNGMIQLSLTLPISLDPATGRRRLDVLSLLTPLATVAMAVRTSEYRQLYGLPDRASRLRTDWMIGLSTYSRPDASTLVPSWDDLLFPVTPPSRLVDDRTPFCPPTGYAYSELQDWEISRPLGDLLRAFLSSFLAENGYDNFDAIIADTVSRFRGDSGL